MFEELKMSKERYIKLTRSVYFEISCKKSTYNRPHAHTHTKKKEKITSIYFNHQITWRIKKTVTLWIMSIYVKKSLRGNSYIEIIGNYNIWFLYIIFII